MTPDADVVWHDAIRAVVDEAAGNYGLDPDELLDLDGPGLDFVASLDLLEDVDPGQEWFATAVEIAVTAYAAGLRAAGPRPVEAARRHVPGTPYEWRHGWIRLGAFGDLTDDDLYGRFADESAKDDPDESVLNDLFDEMGRRESDSAADARIDALVGQGRDYRAAYAQVHDLDPEELDREERRSLLDQQRLPGETREQAVRRLFRDAQYHAYLEAEEATNGHMLNNAGRAARVNSRSLFAGQRSRARKYASPELLDWWEEHPRQTYAEFRAELFGGPGPNLRKEQGV